MNLEKKLKRIETVRIKIRRWSRTAERRTSSPPSHGYIEACLEVQKYKSELAHLEELVSHEPEVQP